jgi:hypothetical protein
MNESLRDEPTLGELHGVELTAVEGGMIVIPPPPPPDGGCIPHPKLPLPWPKLPPLGPIGRFPA